MTFHTPVKSLKVSGEAVDLLCVQEFSDDVGGLQGPDSLLVLVYGARVVSLLVQVVAVLAKYVHQTLLNQDGSYVVRIKSNLNTGIV